MDTTQSGTHGLGLRTQQVYIAVEQCLVISRGGGVDNHLASAITLRLVLLYNLSPQQAGGTELGNLHEIVLANTHIKLDALSSQIHIHTSIGQLLQILVTPSQSIAQLLNDVGTCIVKCIAMNDDAAEIGILLERLGQFRTKGEHRCYILTRHHNLLHGVPLNRAYYLFLVVTLLGPISLQDFGQFERMTLTGREVNLYALAVNAIEQCLDSIHRNQLSRNMET